MSNSLDLINAIESGKVEDIEAAFEASISTKMVAAFDVKRAEIASKLFTIEDLSDETIEDIPGE